MTKTGFRLLPYMKGKNCSSGPNEFNDLENRKSRGIPLRDTASRKRVAEALEYLYRHLHGLRRRTAKHDHLIGRVRASRRPMSTAKAICRDYLKADQRGPVCDASDVQELWAKVFKRQGRIIYPEQERIFRQLDRKAIQGTLSRGELERADKVLRMFKVPGPLNREWAKAELLTDLALNGGVVAEEDIAERPVKQRCRTRRALTQIRSAAMSAHVLLSEHRQTSRGHRQINAIDPNRTSDIKGLRRQIYAYFQSSHRSLPG